jgi:hypothetical protein
MLIPDEAKIPPKPRSILRDNGDGVEDEMVRLPMAGLPTRFREPIVKSGMLMLLRELVWAYGPREMVE